MWSYHSQGIMDFKVVLGKAIGWPIEFELDIVQAQTSSFIRTTYQRDVSTSHTRHLATSHS